IKNEQLKFLQDKEQKLNEELEKDKNQLNHVLYNVKRISEERLHEEQQLHIVSANLAQLKEEVEELRIQQQSAKVRLDQTQKQASELQNQLYKTDKDIEILKIQRDALEQESIRNIDDTASKEVQLLEFNKLVAELTHRLDSKQHEFVHLQKVEDELKEQLSILEETLSDNKDELNALSRRMDARQNEYNLTKSMVDNLEGFPESIRFLKKSTQWAKKAPLLSDILFCKEEYRIPIENFLEPLMNHYVVENYDDAIEAIKLLSDSSRGKANFFILNNIPEVTQKTNVPDNSIPVLAVTETDKKYQTLFKYLLHNVYLVNDGAEKDLNNEILKDEITLIGKSGKFNKSKFTLSGGSVGLFEGKRIGRAKNLENLNKEVKDLENQIKKLKAEIEEGTIKITSL
ncbi:chromosome segregation protein SMC, partial [Pseudoxanthomonas sp. SGD-10]